jgi:septal ring factor EnvC (AmiA/AmiB activator)
MHEYPYIIQYLYTFPKSHSKSETMSKIDNHQAAYLLLVKKMPLFSSTPEKKKASLEKKITALTEKKKRIEAEIEKVQKELTALQTPPAPAPAPAAVPPPPPQAPPKP